MKKIKFILILLTITITSLKVVGQDRVLSFQSYCYQVVSYTDTLHRLCYTRHNDSTLIIYGFFGARNCGTEFHYTATIDSNRIVLSEQIIDTVLLTCLCDIRIEMNIDSFSYNKFYVEYQGSLLTKVFDEIENKLDFFRILPNPANDYFTIEFPISSEKAEVKIFDIYGNLRKEYFLTNNINRIDIAEFKRGLYFVKIGNRNQTMKLIKQ